jgi:hypothetical protein
MTARARLDGKPLTRRDRWKRIDWANIRFWVFFAAMLAVVIASAGVFAYAVNHLPVTVYLVTK